MMRIALALFVSLATSCAKAPTQPPKPPKPKQPPPTWVHRVPLSKEALCGVGVAGAGFNERSPYPKELSRARAVRNLAGILETSVQEAIVDREINQRSSINTVRILTVDEDLIAQVDALAKLTYWLDRDGTGPFAAEDFTYAKACVDPREAATTLHIDPSLIAKTAAEPIAPKIVPAWINKRGKQRGGRLCTVGFSLPTFHPDKMFEGVVEDVRGQLAEVIETLVSSYYEELSSENLHLYETMNVATTQALAKGVIVTHFWYDRDGIGPFSRKRTTYGWGCVYPMDVVQQSLAAVAQESPEDKDVIQRVRDNAQAAFDALDTEIAKRSEQGH